MGSGDDVWRMTTHCLRCCMQMHRVYGVCLIMRVHVSSRRQHFGHMLPQPPLLLVHHERKVGCARGQTNTRKQLESVIFCLGYRYAERGEGGGPEGAVLATGYLRRLMASRNLGSSSSCRKYSACGYTTNLEYGATRQYCRYLKYAMKSSLSRYSFCARTAQHTVRQRGNRPSVSNSVINSFIQSGSHRLFFLSYSSNSHAQRSPATYS